MPLGRLRKRLFVYGGGTLAAVQQRAIVSRDRSWSLVVFLHSWWYPGPQVSGEPGRMDPHPPFYEQ